MFLIFYNFVAATLPKLSCCELPLTGNWGDTEAFCKHIACKERPMGLVISSKEQRKPKFLAEIFLSAKIPFPLKGNRNQFLCFRFRFSRNRKHKIIFGFNRIYGRNLDASKP